MTTKRFNGKAIYQPTGKAAEYSPWACNFYTGCSNDCEYCYCKRGVMSHVWSTEPKLKKCFKNECHALGVFCEELDKAMQDYPSVKEYGILFSFTTDPLLPETRDLTFKAIEIAMARNINVQVLTKRVDWFESFECRIDQKPNLYGAVEDCVSFGFTLTGVDEKEPGASINKERIALMRHLHVCGFKTFASIEPVISVTQSKKMIEDTLGYCDLYKVGLISGKGKDFYNYGSIVDFYGWLTGKAFTGSKIYLKDSFLNYLGINRDKLVGEFVNADYNIFFNKKGDYLE